MAARRLPRIAKLATTIGQRSTGAGTDVARSVAYLVANNPTLNRFHQFEDLIADADRPDADRTIRGAAHHLEKVVNAIATELWSREVFLGGTVIADLVFGAARRGQPDPLVSALEFVRDKRLARPGLVVFPLHSFGILGAGPARTWGGRQDLVVNDSFGYAITPQTNNVIRTIEVLQEAAAHLGVDGEVAAEDVRHYERSRAGWLQRNPFLVVRIRHLPGSYYENQALLMRRVQAVTGLLAMLASFQPSDSTRIKRSFGTANINNWQTLDIGHYLTLWPRAQRRTLETQAVPINLAAQQLSEMMDLGVQLDPAYRGWRQALFSRIESAVEGIHAGALRAYVKNLTGTRARMYDKLFRSMFYFRASYRTGAGEWSRTLTMATALEMLLTDGYEGSGVDERMRARAEDLLRGTRGTKSLQAAVVQLYRARNQQVHSGAAKQEYEIDESRRAYVLCYCAIAERIPALGPNVAQPMRQLCAA